MKEEEEACCMRKPDSEDGQLDYDQNGRSHDAPSVMSGWRKNLIDWRWRI